MQNARVTLCFLQKSWLSGNVIRLKENNRKHTNETERVL